ncbi:MAG TPA: AraC family transcriptional regulator [Planctomycetota bacterium]|nr:AraC family transcriptional regulator [Planctomycetota bacterium]
MQRLEPGEWLAGLSDSRSRVTLPREILMRRYALGDWSIPPRVLPGEHLMYWIAQGTVEGSVGGLPVRWDAGTLIWVAPGVPHQFTMGAGVRRVVLYNLRFQVALDGRLLRLKPDLVQVSGAVDLEALFATVVDEAQAPGRYAEPMLKALIAQLAVRIFRATESVGDGAPRPRVLSRFQRDRLARFAEETVAQRTTPADLARLLTLSPDYFARVFRPSYGVSPKRWLVEQRIRRAAVQLTQSSRNVSEVARELGYPDLFLFSRQFKSVMGMSPRAYRQRADG